LGLLRILYSDQGGSTHGIRTMSHLIRVALESALSTTRVFIISVGTVVSMTAMHLYQHPELFDEPAEFELELWLHVNKATDAYVFRCRPQMCVS
jgi:hypothetical protein